MSQTPERHGHRKIPAEASQRKDSRTRAIICSLRVWAPGLHTIHQQINLSRLTSFIDCRADEEVGDWMWLWGFGVVGGVGCKEGWRCQRKETLVALTARQEREMCRKRRREIDTNRADSPHSVSVWSREHAGSHRDMWTVLCQHKPNTNLSVKANLAANYGVQWQWVNRCDIFANEHNSFVRNAAWTWWRNVFTARIIDSDITAISPLKSFIDNPVSVSFPGLQTPRLCPVPMCLALALYETESRGNPSTSIWQGQKCTQDAVSEARRSQKWCRSRVVGHAFLSPLETWGFVCCVYPDITDLFLI